ncbi:MAG: AmmeMemoRadiSam system protein B [Candidatus Zixiibacteriota bacterium]|nr:MAG: AmmeMemoRadiSam system protein B [candidate division Zixibacteria bacterium]
MEVRQPAVAGAFYPGDPVQLTKLIAQFYSEAKKKSLRGRPIVVIAPHAGYVYSGQTASMAYKQLEGQEYDSVVVISPSHTVFFQGASVYDGGAYMTPLGTVEIDEKLSREIGSIHPGVYLSNKGHTGGSVRGEHALEVQLPYLQQVLGKFKLVAVVMGDQEEPTCRALGEVLASVLTGKNSLIVASTDLSHFHSEKEARRLDGNIQKAVEEYDPDRLLNVLSSGRGEACGGGPVVAALIASKRLGGEELVVTGYSTSGQTTGDFSEVVGYLSAVVVSSRVAPKRDEAVGKPATEKKPELSAEDRAYLLDLARASILARMENRKVSRDEPPSRILKENRGAFVTLKRRGMLRGCIGMIRAAQPLYETIIDMAQAAAFEDSRFMPLAEDELDDIEIEISALSPLVRVEDVNEVEVGRDGLMIVLESHSGLLLPQVAVENNWGRTTFLEQTCLKAGLPKSSYKDRAAKIYRFTAEIF